MQKLATPEIRQFIISGVTVIRASANYTKNEKIYLLRQLLAMGAGAGWQPKAITYEALKLFKSNNFTLPKGLERAHFPHRRDTLNLLLERDWVGDEWWDWYKERDYTTLALKHENRAESNFHELRVFPIPISLGLFKGKNGPGFVYKEEEKTFLEKLANEVL